MENIEIDNLNTGDLILCHGENKDGHLDPGLDGLIEFFTKSPWEHAAIIIKDPWWTTPKLEGMYIFQSGSGPNGYKDVLNGNVSGCTLNHLNDFLANRDKIYIRQIKGINWGESEINMFQTAFEKSHGKPYDKNVCSWIGSGLGSFFNCRWLSKITTPPETENFWCSALVAWMYVSMKWIPKDTDWSSLTPEDLANITFNNPYEIGNIVELKP